MDLQPVVPARRAIRRARSSALAEELAPIVGRARIVVIPHGVSPRSEPLPRPESPSVLLFGRLEQYKGVEVLVEAMRLVWERRPEVRLVVAGEGQAARLVPDDPRISLIPRYISEREVETLLAEASLVVLPYTQASQSGVGVLAIARGVPVVVSDLGALPELAYDRSFVVEAGNPRALAETIVRHLDDGAEVRSAVLRHAQARFSWDHAAQLSTELYRELITQNGATRDTQGHRDSPLSRMADAVTPRKAWTRTHQTVHANERVPAPFAARHGGSVVLQRIYTALSVWRSDGTFGAEHVRLRERLPTVDGRQWRRLCTGRSCARLRARLLISTPRHSRTRSHGGRSPCATASPTIRCSRSTLSPSSPTGCRPSRSGASGETCRSQTTARVRRRRDGAAIRDHQGCRAQRSQGLAARHPAGAGVRGADQRVPGRGRGARRRPRGRHDAAGRLPVHLLPGLDHADALRRRAQLPAPGEGRQARQRRLVRGRSRPRFSASSIATSTARSATSRRCRPWPRRPPRARRRRVPAVVRPALGRDRGGRLDLVLDPVLHAVHGAGGGRVAGSTGGCDSCTSLRGRSARRSPSTRPRSPCSDPCRSSAAETTSRDCELSRSGMTSRSFAIG